MLSNHNSYSFLLLATYLVIASLVFSNVYKNALAQSSVVVPNGLENTAGAQGIIFPWNCADAGFVSQRHQEVYLGTQFPPGINTIQAINFRQDEFHDTGIDVVFPNVEVYISVTDRTPETMSEIFEENLGLNTTQVRSGSLPMSVPVCNTNPCPFDIVVPLQNVYPYNAADGNLLVDIKIFECVPLANTVLFDQHDVPSGDFTPVARVYSTSVDSPQGVNVKRDGGLVTEFVLIQGVPRNVPTLSEWGLIAMAGVLGIVGFMVIRRRQVAA